MASFDFPTLGASAGRWCVNYKSCTALLLKLLGFWLVIHYNYDTNESSPILNVIENMSKTFSRGKCLIWHLVCAILMELKTFGKQHQNPCSELPLVYQDLSTCHVYGLVKKPKPIRLKGNFKRLPGNLFESLGRPDQGYWLCFTGVTNYWAKIMSVTHSFFNIYIHCVVLAGTAVVC